MARPRRYPVPAAPVRVEDRIEHSRFIATLARADTVADAKAAIDAVRDEFPDATHHCFAYAVGPPGSTDAAAAGDAGEPAGTAGRPMLGALLNSGLGDVVVVATRYFGGVKLGKGGLVRAYRGVVQHALREVRTRERVDVIEMRVNVPYASVDAVRRAVEREGGEATAETFGEDVTLALRVPEDRAGAIARAVADATAGRAKSAAPPSSDGPKGGRE
jgi:uncharacterized YigZ family protein